MPRLVTAIDPNTGDAVGVDLDDLENTGNGGGDPADLVSSDADNSLVQGSDDKLFVPDSGIRTANVLVTSAQIFTLFSSPKTLIAAPGDGLAVVPQFVWMLWVPGVTPFVCDTNPGQRFVLAYAGGNVQEMFLGDPTGNTHVGFVSNGNESGSPGGSEPINLDGTVAQYFASSVTQASEYFGGGTNLASAANNKALTLRLSAEDPTVLGNGTLSLRIEYRLVPTVPFGS